MNTILRKTLALITVAFFTFSTPSSVSLYAWPWSKASDSNTQRSDSSTTASFDGSIGSGTASGRGSVQTTGPNFNASGDAVVGANARQGVVGGEVRGQVATNVGGIPANATGSASAIGRGTIDSSGRPSVDIQTQTNVTGSVGGQRSTQGSSSINSGSYAQTSVSHTSQSGNASFNASANAGSFAAQGDYSARADSSGARVDAHGNVRAALAEAEIRTHYQTGMGRSTVNVTAGGRTTVGVEGTGAGHVSVDRSGVGAGGNLNLIAGARQTADAGATLNILGLVKITTRVEGEVVEGLGLKAHANVQASARGIAISTGFAAAPGAGAGLTTEFEIDVSGITEPIGKAIDAVAGAIGKGAKGLFDKIFGNKEEKEAEEEAACGAKGDNIFCADESATGPRPGPRPDPEAERRHQEQERRREREERRREEEERKRREKEEEKERKRQEKEERKKEAEETWRKLPPLPKPKSGGATGRVFDPEMGEITEGVMEPDGTTTVTKRDEHGNIISQETRRDGQLLRESEFSTFDAVRQGGVGLLAPGGTTPTAFLDGISARDAGVGTGAIPIDSQAKETSSSYEDYES